MKAKETSDVGLDVSLPAGLRWQYLTSADHEQVYALHLACLQGISSGVVRKEDPGFFAAIMLGHGEVIGVFNGSDMIAYAVLQRTLAEGDDPRPEWIPNPNQPLMKLAGSGVLQSWRGMGLQKSFIAQRVRMAGSAAQLFSTASPGNPASWRNLLRAGFFVRAIKLMYSGAERFICVRTPVLTTVDTAMYSEDEIELDCFDTETQQHLICQGWYGVAVGLKPNAIRYRRLSQSGDLL